MIDAWKPITDSIDLKHLGKLGACEPEKAALKEMA